MAEAGSSDVQRISAGAADGVGSVTTVSRVLTGSGGQSAQPSGDEEQKPIDIEALADDVWRIIRRRLTIERERERGFS